MKLHPIYTTYSPPFGMLVQERVYTATEYRFGFNGKEIDDEISGAGNTLAFEARIYDSRLGRFFSPDPLEAEYSWQSTYSYYGNSPISVVDHLGMGSGDPVKGDKVQKGEGPTDYAKRNGTSLDVLAQNNPNVFKNYPSSGTNQDKQDYWKDNSAMNWMIYEGQQLVVGKEHGPNLPTAQQKTNSPSWHLATGQTNSVSVVGTLVENLVRQPFEEGLKNIGLSEDVSFYTSHAVTIGVPLFFGIKSTYVSRNSKPKIAPVRAVNGRMTAYETALAGGKHSGFLKNYVGRNADEINKAIKTLQSGKQGIGVHLDKIANPTKYVPNWSSLRPSHQQSLIHGWQNTVTKHSEQIQILNTLLGK